VLDVFVEKRGNGERSDGVVPASYEL